VGPSLVLLIGLLVGIALGVAAGIWLARSKTETQKLLREQSERSLLEQLVAVERETARWRTEAESRAPLEGQLASQSTLAAERLKSLAAVQSELETVRHQLLAKSESERQQAALTSQLETTLAKERESAQEKLKLLTEARVELSHQFEALAGKILDEKSTKFTEQNKVNLDQLLGPLRLQITDFRGKVEEAQKESLSGRVELRSKLEMLEKLNQQLSTDAHNLTTALRGSNKAQGDWGEFILRDLLEKAGLREGEQYRFQESFSGTHDEDGVRGKSSRTDVILNLPGGRHLIVDSKVSLNAYTDYCHATADDLRKLAIKSHLISIRSHFDGLAKRAYHKLSGLDSPDFVVMFVPVEPAFLLAMQEGGELWREAYQRNVLLVGPTTLLFVIRIVDNLWQQEQQARSVEEIVDRGTRLYEKFVNFVSDLSKVGESLRAADASYQNAMGKLSTGSGNLVGQVEKLKRLGIRTNKTMPPRLLESAGIGIEEQAELALAASADEPPPLA
jgi:DNA recombination protein RmuC